MKKSNKISSLINDYAIFIVAVSICFIINAINSQNSFIINVLKSKNIDKLFQSTITCTSIIFGFSSTLIVQILNVKREINKKNSENDNLKKTKLNWFFNNDISKKLTSTILISVFSSIGLILISLLMLITDAVSENAKIFIFYIWFYIFIIFIYYEIGIYHLFISLLFDDEEQQYPMKDAESPIEIEKCINSINNAKNHS